MKLLKVEEHKYLIIYIDDNKKSKVYRRFNENKWQVYSRENWKDVIDSSDLEKMFKTSKYYEKS